MSKYPQLEDKEWLYKKYWVEKLSSVEIAKEVGCSYSTVLDWMEKLNIPRRSLSEAGKIKTPVKYPELQDRDWLFRKYWMEELSTFNIAEELGCCPQVVGKAMRRLNIPRRPRSEAVSKGCERVTKYPLLHDAEWLKEQYVDREHDSCDIARIVGCSPVAVCNALEKAGIKRRSTFFYYTSSYHQKQRKYHQLYNKEWMIQKYVTEGLSQTEIAAIVGCSPTCVSRVLKSLGIPIRSMELENNPNFKYPKAHDRDFLWQRYIVEQKRITEIAEEIGCSRTIILKSLKKFEIPIKSIKEQANDERGKQERSENALKQWRNSEVAKKMFAGLRAKPNKFEYRIDKVLQKYIPGEWAYNGGCNCGITIGGLIPDFVNINGRMQLIECFGDVFHDGTLNNSWKMTEFGRKAIFSQHGYETLILWQSVIDKMSDNEIAEVVKQFMEAKSKKHKKRVRK